MGDRHHLRPEEVAYLMALAARLGTYGFTDAKSGVGTDGSGKPYVFLSGCLDGAPMECSVLLDAGAGLALESLSAVVEVEALAFRRRRVMAEVSRG